MILTDREIQVAIAANQIVISPPPDQSAYSSTSLDLKLSSNLRIWNRADTKDGVQSEVVEPGKKGYSFADFAKKNSQEQKMSANGRIVEPGDFLLGWTNETVKLPVNSRLAARVEGKSGLARLGIGVHITAPTIHAGFEGAIQLEICNHGCFRVCLTPGMAVCQLIFEQTLGTPQIGYKGQFLGQVAE